MWINVPTMMKSMGRNPIWSWLVYYYYHPDFVHFVKSYQKCKKKKKKKALAYTGPVYIRNPNQLEKKIYIYPKLRVIMPKSYNSSSKVPRENSQTYAEMNQP